MPFPFSSPYYKGPLSDHFDGTRFFNPWDRRSHSWKNLLRWKLTDHPKPWPCDVQNGHSDMPPQQVKGEELRICFVGHSTVLIQTQGLNILTDPLWSTWAAPIKWSRSKRVCPPGIIFDHLPPIHLVLISHNHYDHLDLKTIQQLWRRDKPLIVAPLGNDAIIHRFDPSIAVETMDWDQTKIIDEKTSLILQPAQHWSARSIRDWDKALWGGFAIQTQGGNIYFAGDSGYANGHFFRRAKEKCGPFRLALLPIGSYEPRWFMRYDHMNPEEALLAHLDLGQPYTLAMHFGTFRLSDEGYEEPLVALQTARETHNVSNEKFRALKVGEAWKVPAIGV